MSSDKERTRLKRIGIDVIAIGLMIVSPFLGLFPGPGGIPIFLAGLGMLASNHHWARRLLSELEEHRHNLASSIFANHKVSVATDIAGTAVLAGAFYVAFTTNNLLLRGFAIGTISTTFLVLLSNKKRFERSISWLKKLRKR